MNENAKNIAFAIEIGFRFIEKGVRRLANLSQKNWLRLGELVTLLMETSDNNEKREIIQTMLEILFPDDFIGSVNCLH